MTRTSIIVVIALTNLAGCINDDSSDDELSSAEQEVGGTLLTGLHTCNNGSWSTRTCKFELALDGNGQVCFLAGIKGSLNGAFPNLGGEASVVHEGGKIWLRIIPPTGQNQVLSASALCVSPLAVVSETTWQWPQAASALGNQPGMQCFLTSIQNFGSFKSGGDRVTLLNFPDGSWKLGGMHDGLPSSTASMRARASCIIPTGGSLWGYGYGWNNGTKTLPLAPNAGGVACALTNLQGTFTSPTDRISLGFNPSLSEWNVTLAGTSHTVGARCFD